MNTQPKRHRVVYISSEGHRFYYNDHGFPWWSTDAQTHPMNFETREKAEIVASQLRAQRARAGRVFAVSE